MTPDIKVALTCMIAIRDAFKAHASTVRLLELMERGATAAERALQAQKESRDA